MTLLRLAVLAVFSAFVLPATAQETDSAAQSTADVPDMAAITQAYQRNDFVFAREGLAQLAETPGHPLAQYRYGRILLEGKGGPRNPDAAVIWLQRAVDQEYLAASTLLARIYLTGADVERDPVRAASLLSQAAARGDKEAQYYLGLLYRTGDGVAQSDDAAFNWFLAAAEQQHTDAAYELSRAYSRGLGTELNTEKALRWLGKSADEGHIEAQFFIANAYETGQGAPQNSAEALRWYHRAAEGGYLIAQRILGTKYLQGDGVEQNTDEALRWLTTAANANEPGALYNLGTIYASGMGVEKDDVQALQWFERAASTGLPRAIIALAAFYEQGRGLSAPDLRQAISLYLEAAEGGIPEADLQLGRLASTGALDGLVAPQKAVPWVVSAARQEDDVALSWLQAQAEAGNRPAQSQLALLYLENEGQVEAAVALLAKAAENGDLDARFQLGKMYTTGTGVELDYVQAHMWLNIAAAQGHSEAAETRGVISTLMTSDQIAQAQKAARTYLDEEATRAPISSQSGDASE